IAGACRRTRNRDIKDKRSRWLRNAAAVLTALVAVSAATPVLGQTGNPYDTPEPPRSLVLSPTIGLTNVGWDDNVFRVNKADHPTGDFTATVGPAIQASIRVRRLRITGR